MRKDEVRTPEQALAYMTDCTLATVGHMACGKRRPKHEYARQISIAQTGVDWIRFMHLSPCGTRAEDVIEKHGASVAEWASQYEPKGEN
jgi:hypothetical protein